MAAAATVEVETAVAVMAVEVTEVKATAAEATVAAAKEEAARVAARAAAVREVEEDELKYSEVVEKAREMGGIGMIIGEILCLFLLRKLPILLSPFSFSTLHG